MKRKVTMRNISKVLKEIERQAKEDPHFTGKELCFELNKMLDQLCSEDFFGTEGQNDPRGDQRD